MAAYEPMLRDVIVRGLDSISKRAAQAERKADSAITKLLDRWNGMEPAEKEHIAGIVVATATTAIGAIAAMKSRAKKAKKVAKKTARKAAVKAVKKMV